MEKSVLIQSVRQKYDAVRDDTKYETGIKISDEELEAVGVNKHNFHGDWNYTIKNNR